MFSTADRRQLTAKGIAESQAAEQIHWLKNPPPPLVLDRPCRLGDGISSLHLPSHVPRYDRARQQGRFMKFVPASGAASRMFQSIQSILASYPAVTRSELRERAGLHQKEAQDVYETLTQLKRFPFYEEMSQAVREKGGSLDALGQDEHIAPLLKRLVDESEGYAHRPKGLIPFHRYESGIRTAFEEQLAEAALTIKDTEGVCRVHFTVSPDHLPRFQQQAARCVRSLEKEGGCTFQLDFSLQEESTDTLALDDSGKPFRTQEGSLLFRPGGHGSLINNLNALKGDVVFIKNIDNVERSGAQEATLPYRKALAERLLACQEQVFDIVKKARAGSRIDDDSLSFLENEWGVSLPSPWKTFTPSEQSRWLDQRLNRPMRVCGVVRNEGEPGGGPFWVRAADGTLSRQIVESAQVDPASQQQKEIFNEGTHFNPVDMVCGLRDSEGNAFDLSSFVDAKAVFIASKSSQGRRLKALEWPGLWNGGMAHWLTLFVEMPAETFNPVKTINDLLRPAHQVDNRQSFFLS